MTTYIPFTPSTTQAFTFQPTLDGTQYNVTIPWSLFGQRYYVTCTTLSGNLIFNLPLTGSPAGVTITSLAWASNTVTVTTAAPHGYPLGAIINLTVTEVSPSAYNGTYPCAVISPNQVTYSLAGYPGAVASSGTLFYNINLAAGYFASTLVFREKNQMFEVTP
jgi:hypothetical protein